MKLKDIRELSPQELVVKIHDTKEELANLKFQLSLHQLDNAVKVRHVRRDLARMMTLQAEQRLGIAEMRQSKAAARE